MSNVIDLALRIQRTRVIVTRFGPIVEAGLSGEWTDAVGSEIAWSALRKLFLIMRDEPSTVDIEDIRRLLDSLAEILDLLDEEPTGAAYYPFKAAELIELYCRMVTGDLLDNAPVPLEEWVRRYAQHVDWQVAKGGVSFTDDESFKSLERSLRSMEGRLDGVDEDAFSVAMNASRGASIQYLSTLRQALDNA